MGTIIKFLKTILLVDLVKGLWVTLKYTPQPAFTFQYPAERRPTSPRFRGVLRLQTEPATGAQTCIVCDQCAKACPYDHIALGGHREAGTKIKVLDYFDFNLSRCSFCGLCAEVCPTKPIKALIMSEDYELGSYSRDKQLLRVDEMYDGVAIEQYTDTPRGFMRRGHSAASVAGVLAAASFTLYAQAGPQSQSAEIQRQLGSEFLAEGRYQDALEAF